MTHGFMTRIGMEDGTAVHIGQDGMTRGTDRGEIRGTTITIGTTTIIITITTIATAIATAVTAITVGTGTTITIITGTIGCPRAPGR